jgi:uncharacterized membrane protein
MTKRRIREMTIKAGPMKIGALGILILVFVATIVSGNSGQSYNATQTSGNYTDSLILNIYVDETGRVLATGYADDLHGLSFLNASQYHYENDTRQLYALTDGLTSKEGDLWSLKFANSGNYDNYHVDFFLPADVKLGKIESSDGLEYLLSASNESLQADVQGYDVHNPTVFVEYQLPLNANNSNNSNNSGNSNNNMSGKGNGDMIFSPFYLIGVALILVTATALALLKTKRKDDSNASAMKTLDAAEPVSQVETVVPEPHDDSSSATEDDADAANQATSDTFVSDDRNGASQSISVSSEMSVVMQTLTPRERTIMEALIAHKGRMTQADLRYETRTPKSSLSGILLSLERRRLITKKEWGRTNVIELSEWFLSQK